MLQEIKESVNSRRFEELDQVSCQQRLDLQFNKDTWEKFHLVKNKVDEKKSGVASFSSLTKDIYYVIYLGGGAQMIQVAQKRAIYVGGLGINFKNQVVQLKEVSGEQTSLHLAPLVARTSDKQEIRLTLGRFGHTAMYNKAQHAVYIFAG